MIPNKLSTLIGITCAYVASSSLNAATIPAGTTLTVNTVGLITSQDAVGSSFEAKLAQDVSVKGNVLLRAGTKVFGKIRSSRRNPRKSGPLTVELASVSVNGRNVAVKTNSVQPGGPPQTARQAMYGHTAGTTVVNPGTKIQFQLWQAANL
jgi:hypothetical protein